MRFESDWMWGEALSALERAERRHRSFFALLGRHGGESMWEPPVDVFESDREIVIIVALPGVPADRITWRAEEAEIIVSAECPPRAGFQSMRIRRLEIPYGTFERRIALPPGRFALRQPRLVDGCLELHLTRE